MFKNKITEIVRSQRLFHIERKRSSASRNRFWVLSSRSTILYELQVKLSYVTVLKFRKFQFLLIQFQYKNLIILRAWFVPGCGYKYYSCDVIEALNPFSSFISLTTNVEHVKFYFINAKFGLEDARRENTSP